MMSLQCLRILLLTLTKLSGRGLHLGCTAEISCSIASREAGEVAAAVQPVLPAAPTGMPFVPVEFAGLTVTPYVNQAGRLAYSLKAAGVRGAGRPGRAGADAKDVAAWAATATRTR